MPRAVVACHRSAAVDWLYFLSCWTCKVEIIIFTIVVNNRSHDQNTYQILRRETENSQAHFAVPSRSQSVLRAFFRRRRCLFAKRPVRNEVINDRNPFVMNFYRIAQERFLDLQAKISSTLHSRHVYEQAVHMYHFPDFYGELDKAWAFWVVCHMSIHIKFCAIHLSNTPHSISGSPLFYFHFLLLAYHL